MLTLLSEIKFWTLREDELIIKNSDFGVFRFNEHRKDSSADKYRQAKKDYAEKRGLIWTPDNKRPGKLKSQLKHFEDEVRSQKIVFCEWSDQKTFHLMLSNGLLICVEINVFTGDIKKISSDKYFVGKIISENICDVLITRQHILISYNENQITFVHLQKPSLKKSAHKISAGDPKIFNIIIGGSNKKTERHLVTNPSNDLVLIWTKSSQNEFFPWKPVFNEQERANLHIYKLNRLKFEPMCYYWTEHDPIGVGFEFSKFNENEIHSVEQNISSKGEVTIECCTYQISNNRSKLQRTNVTSIPLQTEVSCTAFSPDHEKLVMGCIDGSVVLFDEGRGLTYLVKSSFIPTQVSWHPDSAVVMIANDRGQLQCYDISLSCIKNQLLSDDITASNILDMSNYFVQQPTLQKLCWAHKPDINSNCERYAQVDGFLLLIFDTGVVANMRFVGGAGLKNDMHTSGLTGDVIIQMYLTLNQVEKAINVLLSMNWDTYGAMCLLSLHKIANYIFKQPATSERENQMQKALGSFHAPAKKLCVETEDEFGDNVDDITRRFFYYLIRYKSFEKAFSLAIDINDADLFMILYKSSKAQGVDEIAEESMKKADEIYAEEENESHHSTCSITSCSICSNSEDSESDEDESCSSSDIEELSNQLPSSESTEVKQEESGIPARRMRKSFSADILNHPPLPRFPRYDVKRSQRSSIEMTSSGGYIPPLPQVSQLPIDKESPTENFSTTSDLAVKTLTITKTKNPPTSIPSELTFQNLSKLNVSSMDEFNNNLRMSNFIPHGPHNQLSLVDIIPKPSKILPDIDQTVGIPLTFDTVDHMGNAFYSSLGPQPQAYNGSINNNNNEVSNEYEYHHVPTTIHQYPLISGTIPSTTQAKLDYSTMPVPTITPLKKDLVATGSILTNAQSTTNSNTAGGRKENGEKNKVKFSDTITVAVVPEISRKEKIVTFNDRMKRKPGILGRTDPRRELAESLPLCHPNEDYLKDFSPVSTDRLKDANQPSTSSKSTDEKKKSSIKVVHFGVV